jgi:hypothetical protein
MRHLLAIAVAALAISVADSTVAKADILDDALSVPRAVVNDGLDTMVGPAIDLSQTIPSGRDVRTLPKPRRGHLLAHPLDLIRYGLNLHPGSRTARQHGLINF